MSVALPADFAALEPFVAAWAIEGTAARAARRGASAPEDRQAFYDAARSLLPAALAYLDPIPFDRMAPGDHGLMNLMLSLAHVALAVEVQAEDEAQIAGMNRHMRITRSPAGA